MSAMLRARFEKKMHSSAGEIIRQNITRRVSSLVITGLHGYDSKGNRKPYAVPKSVVLRVASDLRNLAQIIEDDVDAKPVSANAERAGDSE